MTESLILYLHKNWDKTTNPQAGFSFRYEEKDCEIWLNTHPSHHFIYILKEEGGFEMIQCNLFRPDIHTTSNFADRVIHFLKNGMVELTPKVLGESIDDCIFHLGNIDVTLPKIQP